MSASALGSSYASTMATVGVGPGLREGMAYALLRSPGPKPLGVALDTTLPWSSVRTCAWHRNDPGGAAGQTALCGYCVSGARAAAADATRSPWPSAGASLEQLAATSGSPRRAAPA